MAALSQKVVALDAAGRFAEAQALLQADARFDIAVLDLVLDRDWLGAEEVYVIQCQQKAKATRQQIEEQNRRVAFMLSAATLGFMGLASDPLFRRHTASQISSALAYVRQNRSGLAIAAVPLALSLGASSRRPCLPTARMLLPSRARLQLERPAGAVSQGRGGFVPPMGSVPRPPIHMPRAPQVGAQTLAAASTAVVAAAPREERKEVEEQSNVNPPLSLLTKLSGSIGYTTEEALPLAIAKAKEVSRTGSAQPHWSRQGRMRSGRLLLLTLCLVFLSLLLFRTLALTFVRCVFAWSVWRRPSATATRRGSWTTLCSASKWSSTWRSTSGLKRSNYTSSNVRRQRRAQQSKPTAASSSPPRWVLRC